MAVGAKRIDRWSPAAADPRVLTPGDIPRLRLGWHNRFQPDEVDSLLRAYPGRSVWLPDSFEFALVGPWRNRNEVAVIHELAATRQAEAVARAVVERCRAAGAAIALMIELDERRRPSFYERIGFAPIEEVITYEQMRPPRIPYDGPLSFRPVEADDESGLADLQRIDHEAFPWLWWNSAEEFASYVRTPGVELYLGSLGEQLVSYIGVTVYAGWGHLDRIAVNPTFQGRGFGAASLRFATSVLLRRGARSLGLSTQRDNLRSQRLYERFGFQRSRGNDYRLYGVTLDGSLANRGAGHR